MHPNSHTGLWLRPLDGNPPEASARQGLGEVQPARQSGPSKLPLGAAEGPTAPALVDESRPVGSPPPLAAEPSSRDTPAARPARHRRGGGIPILTSSTIHVVPSSIYGSSSLPHQSASHSSRATREHRQSSHPVAVAGSSSANALILGMGVMPPARPTALPNLRESMLPDLPSSASLPICQRLYLLTF
jgi:hypothetical protein